jgi:hypothetical protein
MAVIRGADHGDQLPTAEELVGERLDPNPIATFGQRGCDVSHDFGSAEGRRPGGDSLSRCETLEQLTGVRSPDLAAPVEEPGDPIRCETDLGSSLVPFAL